MVSLVITSMLIATTYTVFFSTNDSWAQARLRSDNHQYARIALSRIERYLQGALPPNADKYHVFIGEDGVLEEETAVEGEEGTAWEADTLTLTSTSEIITLGKRTRADICQVQFFLNTDPELPELGLMMRRKPLPDGGDESEGGTVDELAPNAIAFNTVYYDGLEWVDEWFTEGSLPEAVQVAMALRDPRDPRGYFVFSRVIPLNITASPQGDKSNGSPSGDEAEETADEASEEVGDGGEEASPEPSESRER